MSRTPLEDRNKLMWFLRHVLAVFMSKETEDAAWAIQQAKEAGLLDESGTLTDLLRERAEDDGWLPIESAPKDGTPILTAEGFGHQRSVTLNRWKDYGDLSMWDFGDPTHWRPLPAPPAGGQS